MARILDLELDLPEDLLFELLFPPEAESAEEELARPARERPRLESLALELAQEEPESIVRRLCGRWRAARSIEHRYPDNTRLLCKLLADRVEDPLRWARVLVASEVDPAWLEPFVGRFDDEQIRVFVGCCFETPAFELLGASLVLRQKHAEADLSSRALELVTARPELIYLSTLRGELPLETTRQLLEHENLELALAVASGERLARSDSGPRLELLEPWRRALLRTVGEVAWNRSPGDPRLEGGPTGALSRRASRELGPCLAADPELVVEWLARMAQREGSIAFGWHGVVEAAIEKADEASARRVVRALLPDSGLVPFLHLLVGRSPNLYARVLEKPRNERLHLAPLRRQPDLEWARMAEMALAAGYDPATIARHAFTSSGGSFRWGCDPHPWEERLEAL
ncbi:MAG: hypothetical protein MI919_42750, partial [Holophagales bacterium]|nr:hypothetical protein [Holophagales bacterium]